MNTPRGFVRFASSQAEFSFVASFEVSTVSITDRLGTPDTKAFMAGGEGEESLAIRLTLDTIYCCALGQPLVRNNLRFIGLQVSNEVPLYISRHLRSFTNDLLKCKKRGKYSTKRTT